MVALPALAALAAAAWLVYSVEMDAGTADVGAKLRTYIVERGRRESALFQLVQDQQQALRDRYLAALARQPADSQARFADLFERRPDGSLRLPQALFEGGAGQAPDWPAGIGGYIAPGATVDIDLQRRILAALDMLASWGPLWQRRFANLYLSMPEGASIDYWPGIAWSQRVQIDLDLQAQEWFYIADPRHNPSRRTVWTGLYYDRPADAWMVSCITPIDRDGRYLAAAGTDIFLEDLFARVIADHFEGAYNMVFRADGRLIADPFLLDRIKDAGGDLDVRAAGDARARAIHAAVAAAGPGAVDTVIDDRASDNLLAVTRINGPDWYFVTVYPRSMVAAHAASAARAVLLIGAALFLMAAAASVLLLQRRVARPLGRLERAASAIATGAPAPADAARMLPIDRSDEIGRVARAFAAMVERVRDRTEDLEDLVGIRTHALENSLDRLRHATERAERYLDLAPAILLLLRTDGTVLFANRRGTEVLGRPAPELVGSRWLRDCVAAHDRDAFAARIDRLQSGQAEALEPVEFDLIGAGGEPRTVAWHLALLQAAGGEPEAMLFAGEDVTERRRGERERTRRGAVLELMLAGAPLPQVLRTLTLMTEDACRGTRSSILLVDRHAGCLRLGAAPNLPEEYNHAIDALPIADGNGSCGTAAATGRRAIAADIRTHPDWTRHRDAAARAGLAACWSQPIRAADGEVLGTFALYHAEPHVPTAAEIESIESAANLAGLAIERSHAQAQLRQSASIFEDAAEAFFVADAAGTILRVNGAFTAMLGYAPDEIVGSTLDLVARHVPDATFSESVRSALRTAGRWRGEIRVVRKCGEAFAAWVTISAIREPSGRTSHVVGAMSDISELQAARERIQRLAYHDALTGLPNRALLLDRLERTLAHAGREQRRAAVIFVDIDHFKTINDSLGHTCGDALLREVARRLQTCVRAADTLARIGGDEFVLVLADLDDDDGAVRVVHAAFDAMAAPVDLDGRQAHVSASIGVALYPGDGTDADTLLRHADTAMYHAKAAGRASHQFFSHGMNARALARFNLESELRVALERDEIEVHFQPQVWGRDARPFGGEALVRWRHPVRGLLSAGEFVDVAEDGGLIVALGDRVLREACRQCRRWQDAGAGRLRVAVNLSPRQFRSAGLIDTVRSALEDADLPAHLLELEITERVLLEHGGGTVRILRDLERLGVRIALDDFGTGWSSLGYLKRFAIDTLKIDKSFVADVAASDDDAAIASAIIALGRALRIEVVAEGVENTAQAATLGARGCERMQGFLFGRPMNAGDFAAYVAAASTHAARTRRTVRAQAGAGQAEFDL